MSRKVESRFIADREWRVAARSNLRCRHRTYRGAQGTSGATGAQGLSGTAGAQGTTGAQGISGTTGATGAQGVAGLIGAQGLIGATGLPGAAGEVGANGPAGQAGSAGQNGKDGAVVAAPADPIGVVVSVPVAKTTTLCVTDEASNPKVRPGGLVTWTIAVRNCGRHAASAVSVSDRLHKGASLKTRGGGTLVRGQLRWKIRTLAVGARRTYKIVTRIARNAPAGSFTNQVAVSAGNAESVSGRGSTTIVRGG